jgi:hypothetical protein
VGFVAIHRNAFNRDIGGIGALEQCEIGGDLGIAFEVKAFLETAIEFKTIASRSDQRALDDVGAFAIRILADESNSVADLEAGRVGQRDFLIPMIAIHDELGGDRWFLE